MTACIKYNVALYISHFYRDAIGYTYEDAIQLVRFDSTYITYSLGIL